MEVMPKEVNAEQQKEKEQEEKVTRVKEIISERTENSNTYLLSDGSKQLEIYPENIRYKAGEELVDYNAELTDISGKDKKILEKEALKDVTEYANVNESGDSKQFFPEIISKENGVVMTKNNYVVEMAPVISENDEYSLTVRDTNANYTNSEKNIEYKYESLNNGVKESIILNSEPEEYEFSYEINTDNVVLNQRKDDRGIQVLDKKSQEIVANISAPNIIDSVGNVDYENVKYNLMHTENKTYLKIIVEKQYFEKEDLKYPITIDPTIVWMGDYLTAVGVWSASFMANTTMTNSQLTVSNYLMNSYPYNSINRVYIDTGKLLTTEAFVGGGNSISDKYIESAYLSIHEYNKPTYYPTGTVQVKKALGEWNASNITWNTQPEISDDYIAEWKSTGIEGEWHYLDITDWVCDIASGKEENHGLVLSCPDKGMAACIYGPQIHYISDENGHTVGSRHMTIAVTYRDFEKYDASIEMKATVDNEEALIDIVVNENNSDENKAVKGYEIYERVNNDNRFHLMCEGKDINDIQKIALEDVENVDLRIAIAYTDGTVYLSNIVSFKKILQSESSTNSYEQISIDTDGDGLEDGYEIWDLKTLWNTETTDSTKDNPKYEMDTDGDGFPDWYEVFVLGTDPIIPNRYDENGIEIDSDEDGWSDFKEYQEDTDPYLSDSDFDGIKDSEDAEPRITKEQSNKAVNGAEIHKGKYDFEYYENDGNARIEYLKNIYDGKVKQKRYIYSDANLNKIFKYYYNINSEQTAEIESYEISGQKLCYTYSYDINNNVNYICDKMTKYRMSYDGNRNINEIYVGDCKIYDKRTIELDEVVKDENNDYSEKVLRSSETIEEYGNKQNIRTVCNIYDANNNESVYKEISVYYDENEKASYVLQLDKGENVIALLDCTEDSDNPLKYNYSVENGMNIVTRSDGFIKKSNIITDDKGNQTGMKNSFSFLNLNNDMKTYITSLSVKQNNNDIAITRKMYNDDEMTYEFSLDTDVCTQKIKSALNNKEIYSSIRTEKDMATSLKIINSEYERNYNYVYNEAGNLIEIKDGNNLTKHKYKYDAHGRLKEEYDYEALLWRLYEYNDYGNIEKTYSAPIDAEGKFMSRSKIKYYQYENKQWPDQVTRYSDNPYVTTHNITYDNSGNPLNYYNDMIFTWERGQDLKSISDKNGELLNFKYNDNNFRTYKETKDYISTYELDESKIIRETLQYKNSDRCYDIWYFYDAIGEVAGYQFSYWVNNNEVQEVVYYEKDKLGNVIGLMNESGVEFATYSYDSWGAINSTSCEEGYETAYKLNNFTYRGYYRDSETGFYYLNNRYYDPEIKQFINADNPKVISQFVGNRVMDNMYIYCDGNPVDRVDPSGEWYYTLEEYNIVEFYKRITSEKDAKNLFFSIVLACNSSYMKSEYSHNCKVYNQKYKQNSYIVGQNNAPFTNMTYGGNKISDVGCEIMAVYNAIISCGYDLYFPDLVLQFSMNGMKLLGGMWGSNRYELDKALYAYGIRHEKYYLEETFLEEINRSDRFILSVVNNNNIFEGLHTFFVINTHYYLPNYNENTMQFFNYNAEKYGYTNEYLNEILKEDKYIVGYLIEPIDLQ